MKVTITTGLTALAMAAVVGCAGLATHQQLPEDQQDALFRDMQNNPAAYRAYQCPGLVVVEPENEQKSIQVIGEGCREIDSQAAQLSAKGKTTRTFRALKGKDNTVYAYAQWNYRVVRVGAREVDANTMHVWYHRVEYGGP